MIRISPYLPVETLADLPAFCGVCGRPTQPDNVRTRHDRDTGRPRFAEAVRCPKGRFDDGHEAFIVSPRPAPVAPPIITPSPIGDYEIREGDRGPTIRPALKEQT